MTTPIPDPLAAVHADPASLLVILAALAAERDAADKRLRLLVAYGREHVKPRPYTLAALADAAGLSISGVRICYRPEHVREVADILAADSKAPR